MSYPPELEELIPLDGISLNQHIEGSGFFRTLKPNRYSILKSNGEPLYSVAEIPLPTSTMLWRGVNRNFEMPLHDINGREIMRITRPYKLLKSEVDVMCGNQKLGSVKREMWSCIQKFNVLDGLGRQMLQIRPICRCSNDSFFKIKGLDGQQIGMIKKKYLGFTRASFIGEDKFCVSFPIDLHVNLKALLIAATILVDFSFYEGAR